MAALLAALLGGCQSVPPPVAPSLPAGGAAPLQPPSAAQRFAVDPQASQIWLMVYSAGKLARLGHDHVIVGHLSGEIRAAARAADSGFHLQMAVDSLVVDPPAERAEAGEAFAAAVPEWAREATRHNMLGQALLDAAAFPLIDIESVSLVGPRWNPTVTARVTLHGATHELRFAAAVFEQPDVLTVIAAFPVRQTDLGLTPFSVLGGALQVRDALDVRLRIVARRTG